MSSNAVCILHVGTEKTGSTSLQRFLGLNVNELLRHDIMVPLTLSPFAASGDLNHLYLTSSSHMAQTGPDDLQLGLGLETIEEVAVHRQQTEANFSHEISELVRPPKYIICSNEHIHSRLRLSDDMVRLRSILEPICAEIRVVLYLRSQHEVAQSLAITAIRNGAQIIPPLPTFDHEGGFDPILGVDLGYFDYAALTNRLAKTFGEKSLTIRIYSDIDLAKGDIIDDFLEVIGLTLPGLKRPRRENTRITAKQALFLAEFNAHLRDYRDIDVLRRKVIDYLADSPNNSGGFVYPRAAVERFMERFATSNESVRSRWFPDRGSLFQLDFAANPEETEATGLSIDELYNYLADLISFMLSSRSV